MVRGSALHNSPSWVWTLQDAEKRKLLRYAGGALADAQTRPRVEMVPALGYSNCGEGH